MNIREIATFIIERISEIHKITIQPNVRENIIREVENKQKQKMVKQEYSPQDRLLNEEKITDS